MKASLLSPPNSKSEDGKPRLSEERLGGVLIDGARHSLIWIHNRDRSVSVLVDRPEEGPDRRPCVIDTFLAIEGREEVETLASHFEEHHVNGPPAKRMRLRPLEPADLGCPGGEL